MMHGSTNTKFAVSSLDKFLSFPKLDVTLSILG